MRDREHELGSSRRGSSPLRGREDEADRPAVERQIEALAAQVRKLGERLAVRAEQASRPQPDPVAPDAQDAVTSVLADPVLAHAESVAAEIRANAEREAERIRADQRLRRTERQNVLAHQRDRVTRLIAATNQVEQSLASVSHTMGVLSSELAALEDSLPTDAD